MEISKREKPELEYQISGAIDETARFDVLVPDSNGRMIITCKGISRINSHGVKSWIGFFQGMAQKGAKITFRECSFAIVEQLNLFANFAAGGEVESILLPFWCEKCALQLSATVTAAYAKKLGVNMATAPCTQCKAPTVFDDDPDSYFRFLNR